MHRRISVSAISSLSWSLEDDLAFWARAGIERVGISVAKLDAFGLDQGARQVAAAQLDVTNVLGPGPFDLAHRDQWGEGRDRMLRVLDAASAMGADCLVFTSGPAGALRWEDAAIALGDALGPLVPEAQQRGVPLAVEHTNQFRVDISFVHSLRDAVDLAHQLGIGLCVETNACWAERGLGATIASGADTFRVVQVSDFVVGTMSTPDRAVPGDGDIPFTRVLKHFLDAGYQGPFDLELVGPRIEAEGYESAITRSIDYLDGLLAELGA
jgi:sugar phosphate isomerase/epimerase